jgi:hypothetical protein
VKIKNTNFSETTQLSVKLNNANFHMNLAGGSRVVPYEKRDMTKLQAAFRNCYMNAPKGRRLGPTPNLYVKPRVYKQFKISI